jgi:KipI family sensor histidine kinase inhibitor
VHIVPVGRNAVLVEAADTSEALSLAGWARARGLARDVVPGAETVLLDGVADVAGLSETLAAWKPGPHLSAGERVELVVDYDGPDLDAVAGHWGCDVGQVVARHQRTEFVSAFCGFAPGFAYLVGADPALHVPRRDTPRTRVPAGSVALAGEFTGVYPREGPGGWQLLGHTDAELWDLERDPPALLTPGTRVRFRQVAP